MSDMALQETLKLGEKLTREVLEPMKNAFVGKDEIIDLLGVSLVAGENLFLLGPPGTAKSALVQEMARRIEGKVFDYLLTRFTEPNQLFGPFDIRRLREGDLVTNTEGMLPEASLVFLDELLNANSAILNSLLMVLNERVFRRGRETRKLPTLMVVGASNRLPEDEALGALFDRFLLRAQCENVSQEDLPAVLVAGWKLDLDRDEVQASVTIDDIKALQSLLKEVDHTRIRGPYVDLVHRLRHAGIDISDRRAVKLQRLIAASALLCGRLTTQVSDLWVLRYIWSTQEQIDVLSSLVQDVIERASTENESHPRSRGGDSPDPERLARDLERLTERLSQAEITPTEVTVIRDQLGILTGRCQWIDDDQKRQHLEQQAKQVWSQLEAKG